jgi:hypothetical protein
MASVGSILSGSSSSDMAWLSGMMMLCGLVSSSGDGASYGSTSPWREPNATPTPPCGHGCCHQAMRWGRDQRREEREGTEMAMAGKLSSWDCQSHPHPLRSDAHRNGPHAGDLDLQSARPSTSWSRIHHVISRQHKQSTALRYGCDTLMPTEQLITWNKCSLQQDDVSG